MRFTIKKILPGTLIFAAAIPCFAVNNPSLPNDDVLFRTYLSKPVPLTAGYSNNLKTSNIYAREVNARDGRWKLIRTSMTLCAFAYGPLLAPAFSDIKQLGDELSHGNVSTFMGYYIPAVLLSGGIPYVLTNGKPVKRASAIAFGGFGVLGFMNAPFVYGLLNVKTIINIKTSEDRNNAALGGLRSMVIGSIGSAVGGYFLAQNLQLGPGEVSMITSNGRWMFLEGFMLLGAYITKDQFPGGHIFDDAITIAGKDPGKIAALSSYRYTSGSHMLFFMEAAPGALVGSTLLGCGLGYLATRFQSYTQGDVRICNNMILLSELTTAAVLTTTGVYTNKHLTDKGLVIQALAYPAGSLLNQFIFGRFDFSHDQSKIVGIETQLFMILGAGIGALAGNNSNRLKTTLIGASIGGNGGFLTYFLGVQKRLEKANFSLLKGTSDMGFTLLPDEKNTLTPGLKFNYTFR